VRLLPGVPNPSSRGTTFALELSRDAAVTFEVYDVGGRRLVRRELGTMASGPHSLFFDNRDTKGRGLPSGVYFVRLVAGRDSAAQKLVIQR
jgi:flagellar hook assembly protein FlgD